ncbi:MAG TPA: acetate--CoA ligase family protein [Stellaceae bacterium]|nr:acetate--CoA ligase family protein [Stellaceae bacterium]
MSAIARLLNPRSIAVIGASGDPQKLTGRPLAYLQKHGFRGAIYPVNPRLPAIPGLICYPDVAALPAAPDLGLVLLGEERVEAAVRALAAKGAGAAIVLASGYAETGEEGAKRQAALKEAAGPMRLLGPNAIGFVNVTDRVIVSASGALELGDLPAGRISVVSQSGGILGALLSRAADRGIGFAKLVSTGNEADLDTAEILEALLDDPSTAVLAVYMEGLRRPAAFRHAAERAARLGKPIVVFKVGRSEAGARSATSHTGALAGTDRLYDALFEQLGIIRAETFDALIDIPAALAAGYRAKGSRVAVLTSTGGAGTLLADCCGLAGLELPAPDPQTQARLAALLEGRKTSAQTNPVDVTLAGLRPDLLRAAMAALLESPLYDSLIVVAGASALAQPSLAADAALACRSASDKPILAFVSPHAPEVVRLFQTRGIPAMTAPETCASVLAALSRPPAERAPSVPRRVMGSTMPPLPAGPLNEAESKALFVRFGIAAVRGIVATDAAAAEAAARQLGGKIVLKLLSRRISHKSDLGGVRLGLAPGEIAPACAAMRAAAAARGLDLEGFLVEEQIAGGIEMILGLQRDPQLGPAVLIGFGGIAAELLGDTALRLLPIAPRDAAAMVEELKSAPLLAGYRGVPKRDRAALIDAILAFAEMAEALGDRLIEAEINPLFVLHDGNGVRAADGLIVLRD